MPEVNKDRPWVSDYPPKEVGYEGDHDRIESSAGMGAIIHTHYFLGNPRV